MPRSAVRLGENRKTDGNRGLRGVSLAGSRVCHGGFTFFPPSIPSLLLTSVYSQYQINASETHSTIGLYSGWDYTEFMALAHVPIRPPNDYYPLGDVLANGQALDGSHINILAIVKNVSGSKMMKLYLSHLAGSTLSLRNGPILLPQVLLPHTCSDSVSCTHMYDVSTVKSSHFSPMHTQEATKPINGLKDRTTPPHSAVWWSG